MKLKIKIKEIVPGCMPEINPIGDWIDLKAAKDMEIKAAQSGTQYQQGNSKFRDVFIHTAYIPLGVAMELPKGFEAIIVPRSSTPEKKSLFIPNGQGVIDVSYQGNNDEWHFIASPMDNTNIKKGNKVCQFRIQLSQKATFWQKLKWLFSSGIKLVKVDNLNNNNRGGMGTTGD